MYLENKNWVTKDLSTEQLRPLDSKSHNVSILAGAGSGKTRTLVHLVAEDIVTGTAPEDIVLFTFTENAAEELRARITHLFSIHEPTIDLAKLKVGTIHSWCFQYLLELDEYINFSPLDELHIEALTTRLYDFLKLEDAYGLKFPKGVDKFISDLEIYHNELVDDHDVPDQFSYQIELFQNVLVNSRLMTFGDMIRHCCRYLQQNGPVKNLKAIYVDEYQDVNLAQVSLIKSMRPSGCRLVVVGDDLQCIYQWRGSDVNQIINFDNQFQSAKDFTLLENYRSRPQILHAANKFATSINNKVPNKTLRPKRPELQICPVIWSSYSSEDDEVRGVEECVKKFLVNGIPENKIAVLLRSVANRGKPFVDALRAAGISVWCPIHGRSGDFIKTFVSPVLELIVNGLREPRNEEEERQLEAEIVEIEYALLNWIPDQTFLLAFWGQLHRWRDAAEKGKNEAYNIREQLYTLLDVSGVRLLANDPELMSGLGIVSQIIRSVEEIHRRRIAGQTRKTPKGVLREVIYAIRRHEKTFGESVPIDQNANGIWVGTIHQSKGLEWPVVIMPMLKQHRFPIDAKRKSTGFGETIASRYGTTKDDERRLFYVAMTRAKERLILTDPCRNNPSSRSEFIEPINQLLLSNDTQFPGDNSQFWDIEPVDLQETDTESFRVGLSDLLLYLECPFQFGLRRSIGVQPAVGDELGYGLGLHELIQRRIDYGTAWSSSEINEHVSKHVHLPLMSEKSERVAKTSIAKRITKLQALGVLDEETLPEVHIEHAIGTGVIHGIVDGLVKINDAAYIARDWKSNIHDSLLPRYERQLQFYSYSLQHSGYSVQHAEVVDVGATEKVGHLVTHQVDLSEKTLRNLMQLLDTSMSKIKNREFSPQPTKQNCENCDMNKICGERWNNDETD